MGALLLAVTGLDPKPWEERFRTLAPRRDIRVWPDSVGEPAEIAYACAWHAPQGLFARFAHLKVIFSLGAGVDHLALRAGDGVMQPAGIAQRTHEGAAALVHVAVIDVLKMFGAPGFELGGQLAVLVVEEGPVEVFHGLTRRLRVGLGTRAIAVDDEYPGHSAQAWRRAGPRRR